MKTVTIRCTEREREQIKSNMRLSGFSLNAMAKTAIYRVNTVGMSDYVQAVGRVVRHRKKRENRSARLDFKLDPASVAEFRDRLGEGGFKVSEVLRWYLLDQKLLFSRPKKYKDRQSFDPRDFYQTPYPMTRALLALLEDQGLPDTTAILDPCAGSGAILDVLRQSFPQAWGFDKFAAFEGVERDFFDFADDADMIVTNPPFNRATDFIEQAMKVTKKAWFLLPLDYLTSKHRFERVYTAAGFHLSDVRIFTRSPLMTEQKQDSVTVTGKMSYAWFCFEQGEGTGNVGHFVI